MYICPVIQLKPSSFVLPLWPIGRLWLRISQTVATPSIRRKFSHGTARPHKNCC